jgi:hypothetical protein
MAFNGNESSVITLEKATEWTGNYQSANPNETKAHFFGRNKLQMILDQDNCMGIRAYYAIDDNGAKQLVLVGATADMEDQYTEVILEHSAPCPAYCAQNSPL